jgi:hypothetical protein
MQHGGSEFPATIGTVRLMVIYKVWLFHGPESWL